MISPSALSLLYPAKEIKGYPREQFIQDLLGEHEKEVRACLSKGAVKVQIDFTEGRLAVKLDPTGHLLHSFIDLNNMALDRFSREEQQRIGVHTCPGGDRDSTHSGDVDYAELLPSLFQLKAGNFYVALAGEKDRVRVLKIIRKCVKPEQRVFVGVVSPIDPRIDTAEEVRDRVLEAAEYIAVEQLGTTDDCGFSPFCDDTSTSRETAFAKIRARGGDGDGVESIGQERMTMEASEREDDLLRSVAMPNAKSIQLARQRDDKDVRQANEALEKKTRELAESLAIMRATLEATTDGILVTDGEGRIRGHNQKFLQMWRMTEDKLDRRTHTQLISVLGAHFTDSRRFQARILEIYETAPAESFDVLELADGRVFERFSRIQFVDGRNVGRVWSLRDITERRAMLEAERAARSHAERMNLMKDEFLATVSHELRTPLNAILGWSQLLATGTASAEDMREGLETIGRNARAQTQLIEDLLDMSRIVSGKVRLDVQRVDLAEVVHAAMNTVRPMADAKEIRLRKILDPMVNSVSGDPNRLQQVAWNLLSNAVKFTPKGGSVDVVLERVNSHVELAVNDSGIGIEPEFLPHVFERFRQADSSTTRKQGGLGLGLAIVKQLVELHGGSIRAKSEGEGKGAAFIVSLPLAPVRGSERASIR